MEGLQERCNLHSHWIEEHVIPIEERQSKISFSGGSWSLLASRSRPAADAGDGLHASFSSCETRTRFPPTRNAYSSGADQVLYDTQT